jgi:hypothetical protein
MIGAVARTAGGVAPAGGRLGLLLGVGVALVVMQDCVTQCRRCAETCRTMAA